MRFCSDRLLGALVSLGLLLAACDQSEKTPAAEVPAASEQPPPKPEIAGVVLTFDGASSETIPIEPRVNYQVTFELKSDPGQSFAPYNDVSPAMPMTSSAFDVYLSDGRYLIYTGETEQTYAGDPTRATRISVANLEDGALVVVDGETVWSGARLKTLSEVTIGKGYLNRTWKGKISRPVVCVTPEGATAASLAADPGKVGCEL